MAYIRLTGFLGELPRIAKRLLPSNQAQVARNCDLESGSLVPLKENLFVVTPTKVGTKLSIFKWASVWFHWTVDTDVAKSAIAGDTTERVYMTDGVQPTMTFSPAATTGGTDYPEITYNLGVPPPAAALTATLVDNTGVITGATQANPVVITDVDHGLTTGEQIDTDNGGDMTEINSRTFNVTVLTDDTFELDDEDGTGHTAYTTGGSWTQSYDPADVRDRVYVYNYVSASGEEGSPSPVSNTVTPGPDQQVDLTGMSVGPAGSYDIFEKYIYRAEDGDYQYVSSVVLAQSTYSDTVLEADLGEVIPSTYWIEPLADMHGIIMLPTGVAAGFSGNQLCLSAPNQPHAWPAAYRYPVDFQIVGIANIGADIIILTEGNPYLANGIDPSAVVPEKVELDAACVSKRSIVDMGTFVAYASPNGIAAIGPGVRSIITRQIMDPKDWQDLTPSSIHAYLWRGRYVGFYDNGTQEGFIFDPQEGEERLVFIDDYATAGYHDKEGGDLYLQIGADIVEFTGGTNDISVTWRSKVIRQTSENFSIGMVEADVYPVTLELIADGVTKHTETVADKEPFRMPDNYEADEHEIEITGTETVIAVTVASSMDELDRALKG